MQEYQFSEVEKKWQAYWEAHETFRAKNDYTLPKFYALVEFPYPSGHGMHVGHIKAYSGLEVVSRKRRMQGYNVLFPIGFDAYGLPTENTAIKTGVHPRQVTDENIKKFIKNSITLPQAKIEEKDQILVWKSYEACVTAVTTQANKFRDDPNFVYLQNIQNFVNDLSEENIKKKLSAGENSYNTKTRDLIIEYFNNRDITESNKIMLKKAQI